MLFLKIYLGVNIILCFGYFLALSTSEFVKFFKKTVSAYEILVINYLILIGSLLSFFVSDYVDTESIKSPLPQSFSSKIVETKTQAVSVVENSLTYQIGQDLWILNFILLLFCFGFIYKISNLTISLIQTKNSFKKGFLYKKIGRISLFISDTTLTPYAFSFLGKSYISLPFNLVNTPQSFKAAYMHELQHIRNKDTSFVFIGELLKVIFYINPFLHRWIDYIYLEQEYACDEKVILKKNILLKDYKSCLLEVAILERSKGISLVGATKFIFNDSRSELSRRIKKMGKKKNKLNKIVFLALMALPLGLLSVSAYTYKVHASVGGLSMGELKSLVKQKDFSKNFPVDINKDVVKWVNKYARTSSGVKFTKKSLRNYKAHKRLVHGYIKNYGHPEELAAVPFIESLYQNIEKSNIKSAAGMWQFIPSTARAYNLRVDSKIDERLDIGKETDAAMRYLGALNLRFQDWRLALLSYNAGETAVQNAIYKIKSRDPWIVANSDIKYDRGYLAKVVAAAIIMKYPEIVKN